MVQPLRPDQLESDERTAYGRLDADQARQFLYSLAFARYARLVASGALPPDQLPPLPIRANWNRSLLTSSDIQAVDRALELKLAPTVAAMKPREAMTLSSPDLPGVDADGRSLPLRPEQLTPEEKASYAGLSGDDARRFLHTRGFLRYCRLVIEEKLTPAALPKLPARSNWDRSYFTTQEYNEVVQVALGMSLVARMPPRQ